MRTRSSRSRSLSICVQQRAPVSGRIPQHVHPIEATDLGILKNCSQTLRVLLRRAQLAKPGIGILADCDQQRVPAHPSALISQIGSPIHGPPCDDLIPGAALDPGADYGPLCHRTSSRYQRRHRTYTHHR